MNKTTSRLNNAQINKAQQRAPPTGHKLRTNNLINGSEKGELNSQKSDKNVNNLANPNDRERRLSHIANSVSGFYRENGSDHSVMRSTHESNFA